MKLLEFQAKRLFSKYGLAVPGSTLITSPEDLKDVQAPIVLKAQVPVGGRGKAGAVKRIQDSGELKNTVAEMFSARVKGFAVPAVLAEEPMTIENEWYVACLNDRQVNRPLIMVSAAGGMDIEEVAGQTPEKICKRYIDPLIGMQNYDLRFLAEVLGVRDSRNFFDFILNMWSLFNELDATLVEINPLSVTPTGLVALDAKIHLDDKAAYRHPTLFEELEAEQRSLDRRDRVEAEELADERGVNYVPLEGDIGMIADGAGAGMLTLDMIHDSGGKAANFCEMGGQANAENMKRTMEVVLSDDRLKAVIISLIGGLTRMDEMATGIVRYLEENKSAVPIVVRMCGTKADVGIPMLRDAGVETYEDLAETVKIALESVKEI